MKTRLDAGRVSVVEKWKATSRFISVPPFAPFYFLFFFFSGVIGLMLLRIRVVHMSDFMMIGGFQARAVIRAHQSIGYPFAATLFGFFSFSFSSSSYLIYFSCGEGGALEEEE